MWAVRECSHAQYERVAQRACINNTWCVSVYYVSCVVLCV
jgi:hypothetical protein